MTDTAALGWKILTHDYRSPLQHGEPVWDGKTLPFTLPAVTLDISQKECAPGWNYCEDLATAASIAGFWPTGRPAVGLQVDPAADAIARLNKRRASSLTLIRTATAEEWAAAIRALSDKWFGKHAALMAEEQIAWFEALARPKRDVTKVEEALRTALRARELGDWSVKRYPAARDAWDAWDARAPWDARAARAARDAWDAWDAWAAWDAWDAWDARAPWDARAARAAWDAWDALTVSFAAHQGWISRRADLLTAGLRDAYYNGLEIAIPTGPKELGWAMAEGEAAA